MRAELLQCFVQSEPRRLGRDFKKHAAGFAEINGMKIGAIDYWRDVVAAVDEMCAPLKLFVLVLCAKRNVMHRTSRDPTHSCVGQTKQIDYSAGRRVVWRDKAKSVSRFLNQAIAESIVQ